MDRLAALRKRSGIFSPYFKKTVIYVSIQRNEKQQSIVSIDAKHLKLGVKIYFYGLRYIMKYGRINTLSLIS